MNQKTIAQVFVCFMLCVFCFLPAPAQTWRVQARQDTLALYKTVFEKPAQDSLACQEWLKAYTERQLENGYLELKKVLPTNRNERIIYITLGKRHTWQTLKRGNLPVKPLIRNGQAFSLKGIEAQKQRVLKYAEDNGHPFAQVRLDSLSMEAGKWRSVWHYQPRLLVTFDSVGIVGKGKMKVSPRFLMQYLRLQRKQPYSQTKVDNIRARLQRLPYLRLQGAPEVRFLHDKAYVLLPLSQVKANQIDGILGVLPNENKRGQVLLTGELNALFYNLFAQGHTFKVQWQRLQALSQRLELSTGFQTLFNSPLQLQIDFKSLKQDSSFVNQHWEMKLGYTAQGGEFFGQLINQKSNLGNASNLYDSKTLPNISETLWRGYGVGYRLQTTDDVFFPRKGVIFNFSIYTGTKSITKNPFLPASVYDGLPLKTRQTLSTLNVQSFIPVGKAIFKLGLQSAYLANEHLFMNELLRIGGLASLRGHNQNTFFASQYIISTLEYRLPIDANSYTFVFYDQAYYEGKSINNFEADAPMGIGVGANLSLRAGVFSLAYALGKDRNTTISFNRAKIHFGVVSKF